MVLSEKERNVLRVLGSGKARILASIHKAAFTGKYGSKLRQRVVSPTGVECSRHYRPGIWGTRKILVQLVDAGLVEACMARTHRHVRVVKLYTITAAGQNVLHLLSGDQSE